MNIVILDGHTLNPGDLDWSPLEEYGKVQIFERTTPDEILDRAKDAEILFTNKTVLAGETINNLHKLKYIGVLATGYDVVDTGAAKNKRIVVTNVPGYGPDSVAQMVFAHILNITNNVAQHSRDVAQGGWSKTRDFCYWLTPQLELKDKILGIVGYGEIGRTTAKIGLAFGMKILIHTRTAPQNLPEDVHSVELDKLLADSDVISLHCPLTGKTKGMINGRAIKLMKKDAILVNCSRGPLIVEEDLAEALNKGDIAAACLDVLREEPVKTGSPLIGARNCVITPHIAWATKEARSRLLHIAVNNLRSFLAGTPENQVD